MAEHPFTFYSKKKYNLVTIPFAGYGILQMYLRESTQALMPFRYDLS